jgi:hypothetical protein
MQHIYAVAIVAAFPWQQQAVTGRVQRGVENLQHAGQHLGQLRVGWVARSRCRCQRVQGARVAQRSRRLHSRLQAMHLTPSLPF